MKKALILLFSSLLVLGACGQKEETSSKEETTKKSEDKDIKKEKEKKKSEEKKIMKDKMKDFDEVMKSKMDSNSEIGQYVSSYAVEDLDTDKPLIKLTIDNSVKYKNENTKREIAKKIGFEVQTASKSTLTDDYPFIKMNYQTDQVFAESKAISGKEFKVKN